MIRQTLSLWIKGLRNIVLYHSNPDELMAIAFERKQKAKWDKEHPNHAVYETYEIEKVIVDLRKHYLMKAIKSDEKQDSRYLQRLWESRVRAR